MKKRFKRIMLPLANKDDVKALRSFAVLMSVAFPSVFMFLLPWIFSGQVAYWPLAISAMLMFLYFVYPRGIYYPYYVWMVIASILGWFNTTLILGLFFYIVITPIGFIMALLGKLQYKKQVKTESNWIYKEHNELGKDKKRLEEPF